VVDLDENGTEAAAATAVVEAGTDSGEPPPEPLDFVADRPFVFAIYDHDTDAILFVGRILDPRAD
jgi:serpin B